VAGVVDGCCDYCVAVRYAQGWVVGAEGGVVDVGLESMVCHFSHSLVTVLG